MVCLAPQLILWVYLHANVELPTLPAAIWESSQPHFLQPLLQVWMNVSSLTPWLSDYHRVPFSGSSGYILF